MLDDNEWMTDENSPSQESTDVDLLAMISSFHIFIGKWEKEGRGKVGMLFQTALAKIHWVQVVEGMIQI